ncbi:MAG: DsbA family protein [Pseudomonadota bacterium]
MRLPALLAAALLTLPAAAQDFSEEEIKQLALQAILENPEIVMEAVTILQNREAAEAEALARATLSENRDLLEQDPNAPVLGNPDGDVTVVEFFDYNCPYCRRAGPEIEALIAADPGVRVVYREFPILGEGSVFAARAALAAREQGLYPEMHKALMEARGRVDERSVMIVAADVGLDVDQLRADMASPEVQAHIDTTLRLAQQLGFNGTPAFVVGEATAPGLLTSAQLQEMVDAAREEDG